MVLAKERNNNPTDSQMGLVHQTFTFFDNVIGGDYEDGDSSDQRSRCSTGGGFNKNFAIRSGSSSSLSSPNSTGMVYHHQPEEAAHDSVTSFKPGFHDNLIMQQPSSSSCFLSFDEQSTDDHHDQQQPYSSDLELPSVRLLQNFNYMQTAASTSNMYGSLIINPSRIHDQENRHHHDGGMELFGWPDPQEPDHHDNNEDLQDSGHNKRPHLGESIQAHKKQCTIATKKGKPKSTQTQSSKDPQSIAAKNRRERISERLKVLQDLVPNGTKVDLVTMLEKAISYVKFLQLQVKVLATDDFWPVQGGKAPELSQVKEAIDAILSSSHRDRNSSSNVK